MAYIEVYDPTIPSFLPENFRRANIQAALALYRNNKRVFQSTPVRANRMLEGREATLPVWMNVPLEKIEPGQYQCQVNLIDQFGRKFAFPRTTVAVLPAESKDPVAK